MTGYFARIARQSGARFPSRGDRHVHSGKSRADLQPIDSEETLMRSSDSGINTRLSEPIVKKVGDAGPTRQTSAQGVSPVIDPKSKDESKNIARNVSAERVSGDRSPAGIEATSSSNVVFESGGTDAGTNEREAISELGRDDAPVMDAASARVTDSVVSQPVEKKFFKKTSGLIEGRVVEPSEVHNILFQEVQEWIAAGQSVPDDVRIDMPAAAATAQPEELTIESERQPGVVRIVDSRRAKDVSNAFHESSAPPPINEQNFELSIGSISVVVEGDDKLAPSPPANAPQTGVRETPRRTSRLSRHYL